MYMTKFDFILCAKNKKKQKKQQQQKNNHEGQVEGSDYRFHSPSSFPPSLLFSLLLSHHHQEAAALEPFLARELLYCTVNLGRGAAKNLLFLQRSIPRIYNILSQFAL